MNENYTWQELHELITTMKHKTETQTKVTQTISRINYTTLLSILTNQTQFQYDKNTELTLNVQNEDIKITMRQKP